MKDLSSKLPETKVLEGKLTDMMKLQPSISKTLIKLNHLTTMPEKSLVDSKKAATKAAVKAIEKATDGVELKKSSKSKASATAEKSGSKEVDKALKKIEKIQAKAEKKDCKSSSKKDSGTAAEMMKEAVKAINEDSSDALARMSETFDDKN